MLEMATAEAALFASTIFVVFGLDDVLIDCWWLVRAGYRKLRYYRGREHMSVNELPMPQEDASFAVLIPAWAEANVIGAMLENSLRAYAGQNVVIFVGCYPNDLATVAEVAAVNAPNLMLALNSVPGPTTKSDSLNTAWATAQRFEQDTGRRFSAVVLHDAEDFVSPYEISVFSALLDRFSLMQLPVRPLLDPESLWVSGHYCDEFAESHLKSMVIREASGAAIPSAGVGCAIRRDLLEKLGERHSGRPFDEGSLTEDYELGLSTADLGLAAAFLRVATPDRRCFVATEARFPGTITAAVRQKSRWIVGIAIAGWDRLGWSSGVAESWMRWRDRRTLIDALALTTAYLAAVLSLLLLAVNRDRPIGWIDTIPALGILFPLTAMLMIWRLAIRLVCVFRIYGWKQACIAVPRAVVGNVIAILAARRAIVVYCRMMISGKLIWDKTDHSFPASKAPQ